MQIFSDNLKFLRGTQTQQQVADKLLIKRERYYTYEEGREPPYDILIQISNLYGITIDILLTVDLRKTDIDNLIKIGKNRLLLPIMIDEKGDNIIEIVTHKAKAGYAAGGYADFTFISELDHIYLPWLEKSEKYRTFPVDGDSMPPHDDKSYIVGKYIEKLGDVVGGKTYIIITKNREMVYKRLSKNVGNTFILNSDNSFYKSYEIKFSDIAEIWEYAGSLERSNFKQEKLDSDSLEGIIRKLQKDMAEVKDKITVH